MIGSFSLVVDAASPFEETPKEVKTEVAANGKEGNSRYSQRKRTSMPTPTYEPVEAKATPRGSSSSNKKKKGATTPASTGPKSSRQSTRRATNQQRGGAVDLNHLNEEEGEPAATGPNTSGRRKKQRRVNFEEEEDVSIPHIYVSPMNGVLAVSHEPIDVDPIEFDSYLNSLDNLLHQGPAGRESSSVLISPSSPMREYEWAEARMKISSLLEKDFPTLLTSKDAAEIAALAAKLRKDPNLSAEEIVRLKLIQEIPTFSEVFQENKAVIEEADRFFSSLELNKAKVASLKYEYSDLRHKLESIQTEVEESSEAIRQIDEQIAQLQGRRAELKRCIGSKEKEKVDLSYGQKMVANSIPKVVQEVQAANSKKPEWECKKENALKREEEILSKFISLRGFFL
ncbi:Spindle assembly abnormal protein [Hirschfeldia incana]|nr:Spindle assembly abnormal protein [Hirschfeldia incana]